MAIAWGYMLGDLVRMRHALNTRYCAARIKMGGMHGPDATGLFSVEKHGAVWCMQAALLQMRAGAIATVPTRLPFLGHDPSGLVERVAVAVRVAVAASQPGQAQQPKVFSPPLATQRHTLIREVRPTHQGVHTCAR